MKRILILSACFLLIYCKKIKSQTSTYDFLKTVANDVNKSCPIPVDNILKLENTVGLPNSTFRYNHTLRYYTIKYDILAFAKSLRTTTLTTVKTSPDALMFKKLFVTLEYDYKDSLGSFLFRIVLEPEEYLKKNL